jgi:hypothetical protein
MKSNSRRIERSLWPFIWMERVSLVRSVEWLLMCSWRICQCWCHSHIILRSCSCLCFCLCFWNLVNERWWRPIGHSPITGWQEVGARRYQGRVHRVHRCVFLKPVNFFFLCLFADMPSLLWMLTTSCAIHYLRVQCIRVIIITKRKHGIYLCICCTRVWVW